MSNQTETPKILAALDQLDPADNTHWTNDGLPNTGVVQRIANDQTIKRPDIQNARPGFDRAAALAAAAPPADFEEVPATAPVVAKTSVTAPVASQGETVMVTDAQLHASLSKQIRDAEAMVEQGRKMQNEGGKMEGDGLKQLQTARVNFHKYFPPMTQAENTRAAIEASNAERMARVTARGFASQLDAAKRGGNARGWNGQAQSRGPDGARAFSRKEAAAMGFAVPGSAAATNRPTPIPRGVRA